jgi:hypothetical protein
MITVVIHKVGKVALKIGQPKPIVATRIVSLAADGEELQEIYRLFKNIPFRLDTKRVEWTGEVAAFIFNNLEPVR